MSHIVHAPGIDDANRLDPECDACRHKCVGDLDNEHFAVLVGCTRSEFETFSQMIAEPWYAVGMGPRPTGLYNFWYAIMDASALPIQFRKDELARRKERA